MSARAKRPLTLLGVLAILAAVGGIAYAARGPAVPAPTITSGPTGSSRQTSASFAFTGAAGLTFECKLDGGAYAACTSPKAYAGPLASGPHTFSVVARDRQGRLSDATSRSWTIDTQAPTVSLAHPANNGLFNAGGWAAGCAGGAGICGSASDATGVATVSVSVRQQSSGLYWNGSAFAAASEQFLIASGTTAWRLPLSVPAPDGSYVVHVRATDALGNATTAAAQTSASFAIDTQAPPTPQITAQPPRLTSARTATFAFRSGEAGARLECRLDGRAPAPCASEQSYVGLDDGPHTFTLVARDAAGNASPEASHAWTVDATPPPKPTITQGPDNSTGDRNALFAFTEAEAGAVFQCQLDDGGWSSCTSPTVSYDLALGKHELRLRALDAAGNASGEAKWKWRITLAQTGVPFSVSGDLAGLLAPGLSGELALTISNPNDEPIFITALTVGVEAGSTKPGCDGPENLQVLQSNASYVNPLTVPAHGSASVPSGGVSAPQILMRNLTTNQDACKGATFSFSYGGSAHS